jgi:anti-sigma factor RsiW
MTHDEIEFLISQHFDGTLDAAEAQKLRAILDSDPAARVLFEEHGRLDRALRASRVDLGIDAEWLTAEIAGHIDEAQARPYRIGGWSVFARIAVAATVMVCLGVGALLLTRDRPQPALPTLARTVEVTLPDPARTDRLVVANVTVGIPSNMTPAMMSALFLADQRHGGGRVVIEPAGEPRYDHPFE